jgi:hypothetical protein
MMSEKIVSAEELERSLAAIERRLDGADNWAVKNMRTYVADLGLLASGFRDRGAALTALQSEADEAREFARGWHSIVEAVSAVLELPTPDGSTAAANIIEKFDALQAEVDKYKLGFEILEYNATERIGRLQSEADRLREALRRARDFVEAEYEMRGCMDAAYVDPAADVLLIIDAALSATQQDASPVQPAQKTE